MSISVSLPKDQVAVLSAIRQVCESTGFGRVVVEIKDGRVRLIEVSSTVLIKRAIEENEGNVIK